VQPLGVLARDSVLREGRLSDAPFTIRADEISYEPDRDLYEASGSVRIEQHDGGTLSADWLVFNATSRIGVATGNVVIVDGPDTLAAEFAAVNLETLAALATDASLDSTSPAFVFEGSTIERTGVNTYRVNQGHFTTCRCPPNPDGTPVCHPWEIDTGEADIRVGGYAVVKDAAFRVKDVPLLYTPFLVLPVKTERQTGFLFPGFGRSSRHGTGIELPFFWAERDSLNLLFRPIWLSKRGFKNTAEFEYVFGERGWTNGGGSILPGDDEVEDGSQETPFSDNRWAYWLTHYHPLGPATYFGIDLNQVSDNQYVVDFDDLPEATRHARFLESGAWLSSARGAWYGLAEVAVYDDLQSPENLDRDAFLLRRLPDVRLASLPRFLGPLRILGGLDMRYTYFDQQADQSYVDDVMPVNRQFFDTGPDGLFDAQEPNPAGIFDGADNSGDNPTDQGDGFFQEGELLADHGHRIDLYPRVSLPQRFGMLETLSEVGFRETLYYADRGGSERREIWTGRWDARMRFQRSYQLLGGRLHHLVEPKVAYAIVSTPDQDLNPLFIPQGAVRPSRLIDADIRLLTRDPTDRTPDARLLQFSVANRFYGPPESEDGAGPHLVGKLRIGSGYDFLEGRMADIFLSGYLNPAENLSLSMELGVDPKKARVDEASLGSFWTSEVGHELNLSYRFLRDFANSFENFSVSDDIFDDFDDDFDRINQVSLAGRWVISPRWELFGDGSLSLEDGDGRRGFGTLGALYRSRCECWQLIGSVTQRDRPSETLVLLTFQLTGFGRSYGNSYSRTYVPEQPAD
jgi:lipopolysaccharide assembly outer membrane protein LptD (OstA)